MAGRGQGRGGDTWLPTIARSVGGAEVVEFALEIDHSGALPSVLGPEVTTKGESGVLDRPGMLSRIVLAALVALVACGSPPGPRTELLERSPRLDQALGGGVALAPTVQLQRRGGSAAADQISHALYIESMTRLRGVEVLSPEAAGERLEKAGAGAWRRLRRVRRRLVRGDPISADLARPLVTVLGRPLLLLSWTDEKITERYEDLAGKTIDTDFSMDVQRDTYSQTEGVIAAGLVDLNTGEVLWKARVSYRTGREFQGGTGTVSDEEASREDALYALVGLLRK
jgi:hypothetical protein